MGTPGHLAGLNPRTEDTNKVGLCPVRNRLMLSAFGGWRKFPYRVADILLRPCADDLAHGTRRDMKGWSNAPLS
jgi:hypothetical protein